MKSKVYDLSRSLLKDAVIELASGLAIPCVVFAITGLRFKDTCARAFTMETEEPHVRERAGDKCGTEQQLKTELISWKFWNREAKREKMIETIEEGYEALSYIVSG